MPCASLHSDPWLDLSVTALAAWAVLVRAVRCTGYMPAQHCPSFSHVNWVAVPLRAPYIEDCTSCSHFHTDCNFRQCTQQVIGFRTRGYISKPQAWQMAMLHYVTLQKLQHYAQRDLCYRPLWTNLLKVMTNRSRTMARPVMRSSYSFSNVKLHYLCFSYCSF